METQVRVSDGTESIYDEDYEEAENEAAADADAEDEDGEEEEGEDALQDGQSTIVDDDMTEIDNQSILYYMEADDVTEYTQGDDVTTEYTQTEWGSEEEEDEEEEEFDDFTGEKSDTTETPHVHFDTEASHDSPDNEMIKDIDGESHLLTDEGISTARHDDMTTAGESLRFCSTPDSGLQTVGRSVTFDQSSCRARSISPSASEVLSADWQQTCEQSYDRRCRTSLQRNRVANKMPNYMKPRGSTCKRRHRRRGAMPSLFGHEKHGTWTPECCVV